MLRTETTPSTAPAAFLQDIKSLDSGDSPVLSRTVDYPTGFQTPLHSHRRGQLAFAATGTITVTIDRGIWIVPPWRAVWIPPGVKHHTQSNDSVAMRSIFIDPSIPVPLTSCGVVAVTPLLRELILYAHQLQNSYQSGTSEERAILVLIDQLRAVPEAAFYLPMPDDRRLQKIVRHLLENPTDRRLLSDWAEEVGAGARTLSRLFPLKTGLQFREWQQQARLLHALKLLAAGRSVTSVAFEVGYDSASAFITMFRQTLGKTPGQYFSNEPSRAG